MNAKGAALIETLWVLGLLCTVFFPLHATVLRRGREKLERLQEKRVRFDGLPRHSLGPDAIDAFAAPPDGLPWD